MTAVIVTLAIAALMAFGLLAGFVLLLIGMRTEGRYLRPSSAPHTRTGAATRRILGVYVRLEREQASVQHDGAGR
jgi:hypothetical protein